MRQALAAIFIISILLTACGTPAAIPQSSAATPVTGQPGSQAPAVATAPAETLIAATAIEAPTPVPSPRWFWAIPDGKNEILAFNAAGQVNSVLDITGIERNGNDSSPIRVSDDRAIVFFANHDKPKAFLLTSDSATPIALPNVHTPNPGNGWNIQAQSGSSFVFASGGQVTVPAILINGATGQASLVADDLYGPTETYYFVRFSADGQSLRFATGAGPVEVHNRDLQNGKDTVFFRSSSHLGTDAFGEIWIDGANGKGGTAEGKPVTLKNMDSGTSQFLLDNGWILDAKPDCATPCPFQAYPLIGDAAALNYSLPVKLSDPLVYINGLQPLDQDQMLVNVWDRSAADSLPALWLLAPDGKSELLGMGLDLNRSTPPYRLAGLSDDNRYILLYPADGTPAFSIYDLAAGKALFSETLEKPYAFLEVTYFAEGVIVEEQGDTTHHWIYNYATGLAAEVQPPAGAGYCTAITPDSRPVCMTNSNVVVYDPQTGLATPLVPEPVVSLSN
jgi:hypothetical protein